MGTQIVVGCKLPNGLHLDLSEPKSRVTLRGANTSNVLGGHGVTHVDADFFESWCKEHADFPPLVNGLIFASAKESSVNAEAKEKVDEKTGFEGIDPNNPGADIKKAEDDE